MGWRSNPMGSWWLCKSAWLLILLFHGIPKADGAIQIEHAQYTAGEATEFVVVGVVRDPSTGAVATVEYATVAQTAMAGQDYTKTQGVLSFAPGQNLQLIQIPILNDGDRELGERFQVKLSNATGETLGARTTAIVTITDNDPGVSFHTRELWAQEDAGGIEVKVLRGNDRALEPFTVEYFFTNSTTQAGEDYEGVDGVLEFAGGEMSKTIWIPIMNDHSLEPDEGFQMSLRNPSSGMKLGATSALRVTIADTTGMETRQFRSIQQQDDGSIQLELSNSYSSRFRPYYSLFQMETSTDMKTWHCLPLISHLNTASNAPSFSATNAGSAGGQFYRLIGNPTFSPISPPSGPYPVGVTKRAIIDPSRRNRFGISTSAVFSVTIWYPGDLVPGRTPAPIADPELLVVELAASRLFDRFPRFSNYAFRDLPLTQPEGAGWPVVIYSHGGNGFRTQGNAAGLNLASHGFVAISADHLDAWGVVMPNGDIYGNSTPASFTVANSADRVRDLVVVLDELEKMNREDPLFRSGLDLSRIGSLGFSWGANTAAELARIDPRCQATFSLDWGTGSAGGFPDLIRQGVPKPSLMLNAADNSADDLFRRATTNAYWIQISNTSHGDFGMAGWVDENNTPANREAVATMQAYIISFFNRYLKNVDDHLLDAKSPQYPRVQAFRKK